MKFTDNTFLKIEGVFYPGIFQEVKKNSNPLQPIFESFTNSLEAIELKKEKSKDEQIIIKHYLKKNLLNELEFDKIVIRDSGIGFNDKEFERFLTYKDNRKGFNNKGSGRLQLVHFFNTCEYVSVFEDQNGFKERTFNISKSDKYILSNNTITFLKQTTNSESKLTGTSVTISNLIDEKDNQSYIFLIEELKNKIIHHYLQFFCLNSNRLPKISIQQYINENFTKEVFITSDDIPKVDNEVEFNVNYSRLSLDAKSIEQIDKFEEFKIKSFKINKNHLDENELKLTSKNEIVEPEKFKLEITSLSNKDVINDERYLFLISSSYLNDRDSDTRGDLKIPTKENYKKELNLFSSEEIFLNDIQDRANEKILGLYPEIQIKKEEKRNRIEKLKSMFLLNDEFLENISISLNDTEEKILEKVYTAESKVVAKVDSKIKKQIEELETLNPISKNYEEDFNIQIKRLVKEIPLQNRIALTHYVARRKLVLELFDKILEKKLSVQNSTNRNNDEALLHNLIFKQHSKNTDTSDLWLINEDFILFSGNSEIQLKNIEINGTKIFKEDTELTQEQIDFRDSLEEKRSDKRPDILLFPEEGKCIIIEFKAPDVNVSDYLNQIQNYATLIRNFSKDEFQIDTFFGYLIGEKINAFDVISKDPDFIQAAKFDYLFRPTKIVAGLFNGRENGSIYMEVIKYSTLYERAKKRNEVFIKKLTEKKDSLHDDDIPF